ncbi:hypothetical protein ABIE27_001039 [Paenibacillus sp. 4624]|uniref:hypothetical protein n=1 Tax=Paenibacillus sp. 4624 TaxID=3156453 RepID=UPI003D1CEEC7
MKIADIYGLPFISVQLVYRGKKLTLKKVLLDTGSASTLLNADVVMDIGMIPEYGTVVEDFEIEIGSMDYGLEIDGILGFNFMKQTGAVINLNSMEILLK